MSPLISIIVPCFNGGAYLSKLASSLRLLNDATFEIIFVDDGSIDDSANAFATLIPEARVIAQRNAGVASARNTGAAMARGTFLQLLDVDDVIHPGKLGRQSDHASSEGLDVVYSDWRMAVVERGKTEYERVVSGPMPTEPIESLLGGWWSPPHAYLIRRSAYAEIGGSDASLKNAQDFDLILRLAIAGKAFGYLPGQFADYYRYTETVSLARGPRARYLSDYEIATEKALALLASAGELTPNRRLAAAKRIHSIARSVYSIDRGWFTRLIERMYELDSHFCPDEPKLYAMASRLLGLRGSETLAGWTRGMRNRRHNK